MSASDSVEVRLLKEALVKATRARWEAEDEVLRLRARVAELRAAEFTRQPVEETVVLGR